MKQYIKEAKRMQQLAGLITEVEETNTKPAAVVSKIDQNLDKIESLPAVQKAAEKIMNDPKLMQQFQQGLSKMGVNIESINENVDSPEIEKIVSAIQNKSKTIKEVDEFGRDTSNIEFAQSSLDKGNNSPSDDSASAIVGSFFGSPILVGILSSLTGIPAIATLGTGSYGGGLAIAAVVGAAIAGVAGALSKKKNKQESLSEIRQLVKEVIKESLNEAVDVRALANMINTAKKSGQEITVNGEPVTMWIAFAGKLKTANSSYNLFDIVSGNVELTIDGEPVELPAYIAPEPRVDTKTPEEKEANRQAWLDRYGPGGGQDTFFGRRTFD